MTKVSLVWPSHNYTHRGMARPVTRSTLALGNARPAYRRLQDPQMPSAKQTCDKVEFFNVKNGRQGSRRSASLAVHSTRREAANRIVMLHLKPALQGGLGTDFL